MARSKRIDSQLPSAPLVERRPSDQARLAARKERPSGELEAGWDALNLGPAGLGNECWSSVSGMGSGSCRSEFTPPGFARQRLRRPTRCRSPQHHLRPLQTAEARFTPDNHEIVPY
jgi:hypothetical protein